MKRFLAVGLLALPAVLLVGQDAKAQGDSNRVATRMHCAFLGKLHQHGPLYNYGPYSGYYPFEPYGPWNSQLQYTGPYPGTSYGNYSMYGRLGLFGRDRGNGGDCGGATEKARERHPWFNWGRDKDNCSATGWDRYARTTFLNVTGRVFPCDNKHKWNAGCGTCAAPTCTTAAEPSPIVPTNHSRRER